MSQENDRRIALFLDFENLVTNTGISAAAFDMQGPMDRLLEKGKVIFRRAYADWSRFKEAKSILHELGVELVDVPPSTRAGKNAADMRLVIDALELCHARNYIDTFVIGSGDSDFCPLAYKLRENDRLVIGIGARGSTSRLFVKACDEFVYLTPTGELAEKAEGEAGKERGRRKRGSAKKVPEAPKAKVVPQVAREVVVSLLAGATGPVNPSLIKQTIVRRQPDFDERDHGFSTFSKLLEALEKEGVCRRELRGRQWNVVPADAPPIPALAADSVDEDEAPPEPAPPFDPEEIPF